MDEDDPFSLLEDAKEAVGAERRFQKLTEESTLFYGKVVGILSRPDRL